MKIALTCSIKPDNVHDDDKYAELDSKETIQDLADAISANGNDVEIVNVLNIGEKEIKNKLINFDLIFNVAEGLEGENREAVIPKICEEINKPFTAAGSETAIVTLNKARTKEVFVENGIPTPKSHIFVVGDEKLNISFPVIIKPLLEGSSKGIFNENLVHNENDLRRVVKKIINKYKEPVLVEEFLEGREFTVGVIGYKNPVILPIVEVRFDFLPEGLNKMDSYEAKWIYDNPEFVEKNPDKDPLKCPADIPIELGEKIRKIVLKAYKALDCRDWSRMDIRLDSKGEPNILEVNALPGFMKDPKENSRLPKAAYAAGWSYEKLIGEVLKSAIERYELDNKIEKTIFVVFINDKEEILALKRNSNKSYYPGKWDVISGKIKDNESPEECAKREILEEIKVDNFDIIKRFEPHIYEEDGKKWEVYPFLCMTDDNIIINKEHEDFKWINLNDFFKLDYALPLEKEFIIIFGQQ